MKITKINIYLILQLLITTPILVYCSLFFIRNPDLIPYKELVINTKSFTLDIEPTVYLFSLTSHELSAILNFEPIVFFYYQYIFLIQFFLIKGFLNILNQRVITANLLFVFWFLSFGIIHCLIQIRFGLANAVAVYLFSLLFVKAKNLIIYILYVFTILTHYSSSLSVLVLIYLRLVKVKEALSNFLLVHIIFIVVLLSFKLGKILNVLPDFLLGRLSGYLDSSDFDSVSSSLKLISLFCYICLILAPKSNDNKINSLKLLGALGFLPYFLVPNIEIMIRVGIIFQYLLLTYLVLTFRTKKFCYNTTLFLSCFFCYKLYSGISAFIGYS